MPGFSSVRAYVNEGKMELSIGFYLAKEVAFFVPITLINQSFFFQQGFLCLKMIEPITEGLSAVS